MCNSIDRALVLSLPEFTIQHVVEGPLIPTQRVSAVCVDNRGRLILSNYFNEKHGLYAYTSEYSFIAVLEFDDSPDAMVFDPASGVFTYSLGKTLHRIAANSWLPGTYGWTLVEREFAPTALKRTVSTVAAIRSLADSPLSLLPNELLFLIFEYL